MLYRYGKKIYDKLSEAMNPEFKDEIAFNPFDLWEGADLKLKIRKVDGWPNYDKSEFDSQAPLFEDDDELEAIWNKEHSLNEMISAENFIPYDTLKEKLRSIKVGNIVKVRGYFFTESQFATIFTTLNIVDFGNDFLL